jgi:putative membrane-bound dehydrogenase-like protein
MKLFDVRTFLLLGISFLPLLESTQGEVSVGNRLAYLDDPNNPWLMDRGSAKLITPQWIGEMGVEAAIVLAIDDMSGDGQHFRNYLSPIIDRLQDIDGRGPVSITCNQPEPAHPNMQWFLQQGVSLETHTITHPCPLLQRHRFRRAVIDYHGCVDLLAQIPNNRSVGFRFGCMDGQNTPSPRAYAEILNGVSPKGHFMSMSTSVGMVFTTEDPELPKALFDPNMGGANRFSRYLMTGFVNYLEDYPYPYVIGNKILELPFVYPNDYTGQALYGAQNPIMIADYKAAIDATVAKRGAVSLCFHAGEWMRNDQMVEVVDHADHTHGKKVKFLNMPELHDLMVKNLLGGHPLRDENGEDNGVRLLDLNADGYMDVVISNANAKLTRIWDPSTSTWKESSFPWRIDGNVRFGIFDESGLAGMIAIHDAAVMGWRFDGQEWIYEKSLGRSEKIAPQTNGADGGARLLDLNGDGICELVVGMTGHSVAFERSEDGWKKLPFALPEGTAIVTNDGADAGLRFADLDQDGNLDIIHSDGDSFSTWLFASMEEGWSKQGVSGTRENEEHSRDRRVIPAIVRKNGTNNGAWIKRGHLYWQNEDTGALLPHHIDQRSFADLMGDHVSQPRSPQASLRSMETRPGFEIALVAAEPLVMDPVDVAWGPDGTLWIAEFACYPNGLDHAGKPGSRVVALTDTDEDGAYDRRTVFADGLETSNTVLPWRDGVLAVAPPCIWFLCDTTGDGVADERTVLYEGFGRGNEQHRGNGLAWGLDGWIYVANGDSGGAIRSTKTGKALDLGGGFDLRIRPDTGEIEHATGMTQHGRNRDDWGNWIAGNNSFGWQIALEDHDVKRAPKVAQPSAKQSLHGVIDLFPLSQVLSHWEGYVPPPAGSPGKLTSGCGYTFYRDQLFDNLIEPSVYFSCPVHNCIHRDVIEWNGVLMQTRRAADESQSEFLRSRDSWFRPTTLRTGPDGALYVADLYRLVIEHPEWIDDRLEREMIADGRLRAGEDRGRIYKIHPKGQTLRTPVKLAGLKPAVLAKALDSPNGWQRDTAHMMLTWLDDAKQGEATASLRQVLASTLPQARLQALSALADTNTLTADDVQAGLNDSHPGVRLHALRVGERLIGQEERLGLLALHLLQDDDAHVQRQAALSLGSWNDPRAGKALATFLLVQAKRPYLRAAALTSAARFPDEVLLTVLEAERTPSTAALTNALMELLGSDARRLVPRLLARVAKADANDAYQAWQYEVASKILATVDNLASLQEEMAPMLAAARTAIDDSRASLENRLASVAFLTSGHKFPEIDGSRLTKLLDLSTPVELQIAAVQALLNGNDPTMTRQLLADWPKYGPKVRSALVDGFLKREDQLPNFFAELAVNRELRASLDATRRQRLLRHENEAIRKQAETLLGGATNRNRAEVIQRYTSALSIAGDRQKGREVFATHCAACHVLDGIGNAIGPDIAALTTRTPQTYLTAILDPNQSVQENWMQFVATIKDERTLAGALVEETSASITLVGIDGVRHQVPRTDLASLKSMGFSLMPEGLEASISVSAMTDLLAYLQVAGEPRKKFENNEPKLMSQANDSTVTLPASVAEVYGPNILFEQRYRNLGFWSSERDRAEWTFHLSEDGDFDLWVDWALQAGSDDGRILFAVANKTLSADVPDTGTWDDYRWGQVGSLNLVAGTHRLVAKSDGPFQAGSLIDLRTIRLIPKESGPIEDGIDWSVIHVGTEVAPKPGPYGGKPHAIPGTIEAEHYDEGPAELAYHDNDPQNQGTDYRKNTQVDIEKRDDASNGHGIGWTRKGEWLHYTVEVAKDGVYQITMPVASNKQGGLFHLEIEGEDLTGPIRIPDTGGWTILKTISHKGVQLKKGIHTIRAIMDENGPSNSIGDIDYFKFSPAK